MESSNDRKSTTKSPDYLVFSIILNVVKITRPLRSYRTPTDLKKKLNFEKHATFSFELYQTQHATGVKGAEWLYRDGLLVNVHCQGKRLLFGVIRTRS